MEPEPVLTQVEAAPFLPVITFNLEMDAPPPIGSKLWAQVNILLLAIHTPVPDFIAGNPYACPGIFKIAATVG